MRNTQQSQRKPSLLELKMGRERANAWIARKSEEREESKPPADFSDDFGKHDGEIIGSFLGVK